MNFLKKINKIKVNFINPMKTFRLQRRLAASVMKCGKTRVWIDPLELKEVGMASNRRTIKKMCKDGLFRKKQ